MAHASLPAWGVRVDISRRIRRRTPFSVTPRTVSYTHLDVYKRQPSYKLFDAVSTQKKAGVEAPRSIDDYEEITVDEGAVPEGGTGLRMV